MSEAIAVVDPTPSAARAASASAKAALIFLLVLALLYPDSGHLRDKAAGLRAVGYPLLSFAVPALWWVFWKDRVSFPWLADLMVTLTCFTDVLGNRMDLYDTVVWFDDWMHFMNNGLLAAAVLLLTMRQSSSLASMIERALAFGATAAITWRSRSTSPSSVALPSVSSPTQTPLVTWGSAHSERSSQPSWSTGCGSGEHCRTLNRFRR